MPLQRTLGSNFSLFHFSAMEWAVLFSTTDCWLAQSTSTGTNQLGKEINYEKWPVTQRNLHSLNQRNPSLFVSWLYQAWGTVTVYSTRLLFLFHLIFWIMFHPAALILLTSQPLPSHEHALGVVNVVSGVTLSHAPLAHTEGEEAPLTLPPSERWIDARRICRTTLFMARLVCWTRSFQFWCRGGAVACTGVGEVWERFLCLLLGV